MHRVALIPIDARLSAAIEEGPQIFATRMGPRLGDAADLAVQAVRQIMAHPTARPPRWGGFLTMSTATASIVGTCGFLGPPGTASATVEMTWCTFPPFERQGFATAMVGILMARAKDAPEIRRVIAHIAPDNAAAGHILEKSGLTRRNEEDQDGQHRWDWVRATFP